MPNKIFEYIACGLPVLAFPHKCIGEFLDRHNAGLVLDSIGEMASQLKNEKIESIRRNVFNLRREFTIEKNIYKIIRFYEEIHASKLS